jgi:hypothetical protein
MCCALCTEEIDLQATGYVVLEKLDGNFVSPFYTLGELKFGTKTGHRNSEARQAHAFAANHEVECIHHFFSYLHLTQCVCVCVCVRVRVERGLCWVQQRLGGSRLLADLRVVQPVRQARGEVPQAHAHPDRHQVGSTTHAHAHLIR